MVRPLGEQFLFAAGRAASECIRQAIGKLAKVICCVYQTQPPLVLRLSDKTAEQGGFTTAGWALNENHGVTELCQVGEQVQALHQRRAGIKEAIVAAVCERIAA